MIRSRLLRLIAILIPWILAGFVVGAWLLARVPPDGIFERYVIFDGTSPWFHTFLPSQRVTPPGVQPEGWVGQKIIQEPVYATARLPGPYDAVDIGLDIRPHDQPLIELGLANANSETFQTIPAWSAVLEQGWRHVTRASTTGYIRSDLPDETLLTAPLRARMVWRTDGPLLQPMDTVSEARTYEPSLRGGHDFYFIPVNGVIDLKLSLQDVNRNRGTNSIAFRLTQGDEVLWTDAIGLSGSRDTRPNKVYEKTIRIQQLSAGIYRLAMIADDDIFIRRITTTAAHWVIGPRLYFGDVNGFATSTVPGRAWTNSQHLKIDTLHNEGRQEIRLGGARVDLKDTHTYYNLSRLITERGTDQLFQAPRADVRILGDGFFAFDPDRLFYPIPRRLTDASNPLEEGIQVIYTPYVPPQKEAGGWISLRGTFPITAEAGQSIRIALSAPGLSTRDGSVDVRAGHIRYRRPPLSPRAWLTVLHRELRAAWHRL